MLDELKPSDFSEQLNTKFRASIEGSFSMDLELIEVNEMDRTKKQERFSLIFLAPGDAPIHQAIYRVEHEKMGQFDLFLVPIGREENGILYEAAFNRLIKDQNKDRK